MNVREGLLRIVGVAEELQCLNTLMEQAGYPETPYWNLFASIVDAIYVMIGENTETLEDSRTYEALYSSGLTDEQRVNILLGL